MKRIAYGMMIVLLLSAAACGSDVASLKETDREAPSESQEKNHKEESMDMDNLTRVEITLPPDLVGDLSRFDRDAYVTENPGISEAEVLENGTLKLTMSRSKHKEMIKKMEEGVLKTFEDLMTHEESAYIRDIRTSREYRNVDVLVDREGYENALNISSFSIIFSVGYYHIFGGSDFELALRYIDEVTNEVIEEIRIPEA